VHNKVRMNLPNIDEIPFPEKTVDLFPQRYHPDHYGVMFTSRGCPWPCTFCDSRGVWTRKIRYRSPENIIAEMRRLYERHGARDFYFWDDTFTPNRKHSLKLFDQMIAEFPARDRPITWQATTRCDCVDDELTAKMKQSGCRLLTYGIETGSPSMMEILRKGITHDKVFHAQQVMSKANITWDAFFMIGFPDDTPETIEETMDLIRKLECRSVAISIFTPYPGLELYERAKSYDLISEPIEWRNFSHQSPKNHFVKNIDRAEFHRIAGNVLAEVDQLNAQRYRQERLKFYSKHPLKIPGLLWRMAKTQLVRP
jgi:anaerobic magnesium-protoporphyrin IX monomethyl ester cyclase